MLIGERLATELRRAWNGEPWHGPPAAAVLSRLTAQQATHRRVRGSHTPWELVLHLTTWVEVPLRRFDDPALAPGDDDDFPTPTVATAAASAAATDAQWQHDVASLGDAVERLAQRVAAMPDTALEAAVGDHGYSYVEMVDGVVQHLAYHAGQIAMLALKKEVVANVVAPAPLFPLGAVVLAELADRFVYDAHFNPPHALGWALIVAGAALAYWAHEHFVARHTPAVPWQAPRALVLEGPYRFTRNPMYLGFFLIQAGIGCVRHNVLYLALLIPVWACLHWGVVLREEQYLLRKFGAPYQRLLDATRRWL